MKHALPPLTAHLLEAFTASAASWLVRLLGVVLDPSAERRRRRLQRFVRAIERCVEHIIFLKAVHAFGPPPQRRTAPRSTPQGFRRSNGDLRLFWKCARIRADRRASFADRLARLLHALARPARFVARFMARLCKGLRTHLIPCAPPAFALGAEAPVCIRYDDTS